MNEGNTNQQHFQQQQGVEPFQVYIRCRPLNEVEINEHNSCTSVEIVNSNTLYLSDRVSKEHNFTLNGIFDEYASNEEIFIQAVVPLAENVLMGINSTVFAYGITGAGKSYTMFGNTCLQGLDQEEFDENGDQYREFYLHEKAGIIPRTF